jgi:hypothetical protein
MNDFRKVIGYLIGGVVVAFGIAAGSGFNWGTTETGTINGNPATDCRAIVKLNQGDWETYWHTFYCSGGECYAESINNGQCDAVYFYSQSSNNTNGSN